MNKTVKTLKQQIKKLLGKKSPAELPKSKRIAYVKLNDRLRYHTVGKFYTKKTKARPAQKNKVAHGLWSVKKESDGTVVFKNKNTTLFGVTPAEFAQIEMLQNLGARISKSANRAAKNYKRVAR